MNRVIKFRAWDERISQFHYWGINIHQFGAYFTSPPHSNLIHCQFTGLHDKNGKELFEGDKIRAWQYHIETKELVNQHEGVIEWDNKMAGWFFNGEPLGHFDVIEYLGNKFN